MIKEAERVAPAWRRLFGVPLLVTVTFGLLMGVVALIYGLPLRDPEGFLGPSWVRLPLIVLLMMAADIVPRVVSRRPGLKKLASTTLEVARMRWTLPRLGVIAAGLGTFYLAYVAYRNLKSFLPFVQSRLTDTMLLATDRWFGAGAYPADVLQDLLGTGISADILSGAYMLFMIFVPISLAVALVWSDHLVRGAWYVTALSFNWIIGTLTYYLLPSLGPIYVERQSFSDLPDTAVSGLQDSLYETRIEVLANPHATDSVHGIAAFASLHVSIIFTAALVVQLAKLPKVVRVVMWIYFALTALATVYFGWHYVLDVFAGLLVGALSVWLAAKAVSATGMGTVAVAKIPLADGGHLTPAGAQTPEQAAEQLVPERGRATD